MVNKKNKKTKKVLKNKNTYKILAVVFIALAITFTSISFATNTGILKLGEQTLMENTKPWKKTYSITANDIVSVKFQPSEDWKITQIQAKTRIKTGNKPRYIQMGVAKKANPTSDSDWICSKGRLVGNFVYEYKKQNFNHVQLDKGKTYYLAFSVLNPLMDNPADVTVDLSFSQVNYPSYLNGAPMFAPPFDPFVTPNFRLKGELPPDKYTVTINTDPSLCKVNFEGYGTKTSYGGVAEWYNIPEGSYTVTVSKTGYKTKSFMCWVRGDRTESVTLEPDIQNYDLTVNTNPNGCTVKAGQHEQNSGSNGQAVFSQLREGSYTVVVSKDGYKSKTDTVYLDGDKTLSYSLEKAVIYHNLTIKTTPPECTVNVGSKSANSGQMGEVTFNLEEGNYVVKVYKENYKNFSKQITLDSDKTINAELEMKKPIVAISYNYVMEAIALICYLGAGISGIKYFSLAGMI